MNTESYLSFLHTVRTWIHETNRAFSLVQLDFLAHLVYQPKNLCNHALSIVVGVSVTVGVGISVVCVPSS